MTESSYSFNCLGHTKRDDGSIERYHLEVTDTRDGGTKEISVEHRHLASARSMKMILLDRRMLYTTTRPEHDKMLLGALDPRS